MPNSSSANNYLAWFEQAEIDEGAAKELYETGHYYTPVCFHCQQSAEKYLKGLLVFYKEPFPKVHDLIELETKLLNFAVNVKELHPDLELLNRYYIETRYLGDFPEFNIKEARNALVAAKRVKEFVLDKIQ